MRLSFLLFLALIVFGQSLSVAEVESDSERVRKLVREAVEYWRGETSYTIAEMTVHRPDWERTSKLKSWTKGTDKTLVRFIAPKKDSGNASLTLEEEVWTFTPKTNRVIKIPPSMKSQSWMGSDFSYQDLSKDDEIIDSYEHKILEEIEQDGVKIYVVESIPHESAPIVWGKELLRIREDKIILEHTFFDQEMVPVKKLVATKIDMLGGKLFPIVIRMSNLEQEGEWTEIVHNSAKFGDDISDSFFSVSSLQNPRR